MSELLPDGEELLQVDALSKSERELREREMEEKRRHLRVDLFEKPLPIYIHFKHDQQIITALCNIINFSLGGMLIQSNETLPIRATMKAVYNAKGILVEAIRQQGTTYGIQFNHSDANTLYEFYLEMIHDVIFDGHISYLKRQQIK